MKVEYKDIYKLGISKVDEQHEGIFRIFNDFDLAIAREEGKEAIEELLEYLVDYSSKHFETEKKYFEKYHYPDIEAHLAEHKYFIDEVEKLIQKNQMGYLKVLSDSQTFLFNWIIRHIEQTDKRYGIYLSNKIKGVT